MQDMYRNDSSILHKYVLFHHFCFVCVCVSVGCAHEMTAIENKKGKERKKSDWSEQKSENGWATEQQ